MSALQKTPRAESHRPLLNLILVEDDDGDAKAIHRALAHAHIANPVIRVNDGVEALAFLRGETDRPPPDQYILLVDLNMPRMNGLELLAELRRDPVLCRSVAFLLTTSNDDRDKAAAYSQQVAGYILKENAGNDFIDLIGTLDHYWRIVELPDLSAARGTR